MQYYKIIFPNTPSMDFIFNEDEIQKLYASKFMTGEAIQYADVVVCRRRNEIIKCRCGVEELLTKGIEKLYPGIQEIILSKYENDFLEKIVAVGGSATSFIDKMLRYPEVRELINTMGCNGIRLILANQM